MTFIDPDLLRRVVVELDRLGFQRISTRSATGPFAEALDAIEAARRANGWSEHAAPHRPSPGD